LYQLSLSLWLIAAILQKDFASIHIITFVTLENKCLTWTLPFDALVGTNGWIIWNETSGIDIIVEQCKFLSLPFLLPNKNGPDITIL